MSNSDLDNLSEKSKYEFYFNSNFENMIELCIELISAETFNLKQYVTVKNAIFIEQKINILQNFFEYNKYEKNKDPIVISKISDLKKSLEENLFYISAYAQALRDTIEIIYSSKKYNESDGTYDLPSQRYISR